MPQPSLEHAPVEFGKLRELIAVDRSNAHEARQAVSVQPLTTVTYQKPLRIALKRRWRGDQGLRRTAWTSALVVLAMMGLWLAPVDSLRSTPSELRASGTGEEARAAAVSAVPVQAPKLTEPSTNASAPTAPATGENPKPALTSPRLRLQRADLWLRVGSARGDREARTLLESALGDAPQSAHGHAALAQACLRLQDQACARAAVHAAIELRPWRGGYRTLARKIDASFGPDAK